MKGSLSQKVDKHKSAGNVLLSLLSTEKCTFDGNHKPQIWTILLPTCCMWCWISKWCWQVCDVDKFVMLTSLWCWQVWGVDKFVMLTSLWCWKPSNANTTVETCYVTPLASFSTSIKVKRKLFLQHKFWQNSVLAPRKFFRGFIFPVWQHVGWGKKGWMLCCCNLWHMAEIRKSISVRLAVTQSLICWHPKHCQTIRGSLFLTMRCFFIYVKFPNSAILDA